MGVATRPIIIIHQNFNVKIMKDKEIYSFISTYKIYAKLTELLNEIALSL